jgi:hypothetical protein
MGWRCCLLHAAAGDVESSAVQLMCILSALYYCHVVVVGTVASSASGWHSVVIMLPCIV